MQLELCLKKNKDLPFPLCNDVGMIINMAIISNAPFCIIVWYKVFKCTMISRHADFYQVWILAPGAVNYVIFYPNQIPPSKV